jgi:glucose dehydrogenase
MASAKPIECHVAIVGAGFAGALIANELAKKKIKVVILEAGAKVPVDINRYMERFYNAPIKIPESPYTPEIFAADGKFQDPAKVNAGRPTSIDDWKDSKRSYLIQKGKMPFASTYDRIAGGTSHWLGTCLRFLPSDFKMRSLYGQLVPQFVDWPIAYNELVGDYEKAEEELGVSGDAAEQSYLDVKFGKGYPMPPIPESLVDKSVKAALAELQPDQTAFLGMTTPPTSIPVRRLPAARNSQPYRGRRACAGNTNCIPICPIQAKYDPTITLNDATNTGHVQIMDRTVASDIVVRDGKIQQIDFIRYRTDNGPAVERGSVKAKVYVIAANAIETPRLLLMSNNRKGVANESGKVGKYLMDHPYYVAWGLAPKKVFPYRGPLITSGVGDLADGPFRTNRAAFRIDIGNEGWNFVVGARGGDPNITTVDFINGLNDSKLNAGKEALFGESLTTKLHDTISRQFRVGFLVEQTPDEGNTVTLAAEKDGLGLPRPQITYDLSDYTKRGIAASKQMKDLLFAKMGATDFTEVLKGDPHSFEIAVNGKTETLTYGGAGHIMGTCRMGDDPKQSVVDKFQRSHDHKDLYVVGSSTFPTGATANPTLTLAALSFRTAQHIIDDNFK